MTPKQITEIFNATRPFTYQEFGRRVAAAARAEAIEQAAKLMNPYDEEGTLGALNAASIRAMLNTGEKT